MDGKARLCSKKSPLSLLLLVSKNNLLDLCDSAVLTDLLDQYNTYDAVDQPSAQGCK